MKRHELEHIIRVASDIADDPEIIVLGSQSILGAMPNADGVLAASMGAGLIPKNKPERADMIDGSIGEGSPFHETYKYYAQGVDYTTVKLPQGWQDRLIRVDNPNTGLATGYCLEPHDLAAGKFVAGREKDIAFNREMIGQGIVDPGIVARRIENTPVADVLIQAALDRLRGLVRRIAQDDDDTGDDPRPGG